MVQHKHDFFFYNPLNQLAPGLQVTTEFTMA